MSFTPRRPAAASLLLSLAPYLLAAAASSCRLDAGDQRAARARAGAESAAEDALLETLMDEYIAARFEFYPVEATLAGLPGNDDRLGDLKRSSIEGRIRYLTDYRQKLTGLRPTRLSDTAHMDLLWLTSLVKAELFELEERRVWQLSAALYAETIREGIVSLLLSGDLPGKSGALAGRLDDVTRLVEQAKENLNLAETSELWLEDGIIALERSRALLSELPLLLEQSLPSYRVADLAERSRLAVRAIQSLMMFTGTRAAQVPVPIPDQGSSDLRLGRERLERFWLYQEMIDQPVEELIREAEEAVVAETDVLTEIALESYPGAPLVQLLLEEEPERVRLDEEAMRAVAEAVRESLGLGEPVTVRLVPPTFFSGERGRLWRPAALEPVKQPVLLVAAGSTSLGASELRLLALIELGPRFRQFELQARSSSLLRRVMASEATSSGFRSWETGLRLTGSATEDPRVRLRYRHRTLIESLRLFASLSFHAGLIELDEVEASFLERGFLPAARARLEARRVALYPSVGATALGRLRLQELANDFRREFPLSREGELAERMLVEGLLPIRLLRAKVLGRVLADS